MTELNEVIREFESRLSNNRINIDDHLFTRFVDGSSDEVLKAIQNQVNSVLDENNILLINVLDEINQTIRATQEVIRQILKREGDKRQFSACHKEEYLSKNTRRGVY